MTKQRAVPMFEQRRWEQPEQSRKQALADTKRQANTLLGIPSERCTDA